MIPQLTEDVIEIIWKELETERVKTPVTLYRDYMKIRDWDWYDANKHTISPEEYWAMKATFLMFVLASLGEL